MSRIADSKVQWRPLGEFIEECDERNDKRSDLNVLGLNKAKDFMPTVANMEGVDTSKYKVVGKGTFVFSGMQTGRDCCIRIGLYNEDEKAIVSPAYTTFVVNGIEPEYFFLFFNRAESDRYGWFISDSSIRSNLDWPRFLDIKIPVPPLSVQRKVVETWQGLRKLKEENEKLAGPLMQLCRSYLQECKKKYPMKEIGLMIARKDRRNTGNKVRVVKSVSVQKEFKDTNAKVDKNNLAGYKIVNPGEISFVQTTGNEKCLCIAVNWFGESIVVTSVNEVMSTDGDQLLADYLYMWWTRKESDRYARFNSWGSARETFNWNDMCRVKIPLPPIEVQQAIVEVYRCAKEAKAIAEEADRLSREICPALVRYAAESGGGRSAAS